MTELTLFTFLIGIVLGLMLAYLFFWIFQVKCPKCQKLRPINQIVLFHWKARKITEQPCSECQKPKTQIEIF